MKLRLITIIGLALMVAMITVAQEPVAPAPEAAAQVEAPPVVSTMKGFVVTKNPDGEETLTETDKVAPGQVVEYHLTYVNTTKDVIQGMKVLGPVPGATSYVAKSAATPTKVTPEFSIDDAATFMAEPVTYTVKLEDGTTEERVATADMYTHVRWSVAELAAEETVRFKYRVVVK